MIDIKFNMDSEIIVLINFYTFSKQKTVEQPNFLRRRIAIVCGALLSSDE
ncbi:hypothetical protein JHK87_046213 [Glycine soja]|nr:hypothetical protein JHK87_046213 [Glycine soja]